MAKDSLFRTIIQGFNKQDVLDYIENLDIRYTKHTGELEEEIDSLKKELDVIPSLLKAKEDYDKLVQEKELIEKEKNDLNEAMQAQSKVLEEKEQLLEEALSENALCHEKIKKLESSGSSGSDDIFSDELEEILIKAKNEAESVIERAQELAKEIIANAKEKAKVQEELAKEKAEQVKRQSDEAVRDNLKKVKYLNRKKDELSGIFQNHKNAMDSFFSSISQSLKDE